MYSHGKQDKMDLDTTDIKSEELESFSGENNGQPLSRK